MPDSAQDVLTTACCPPFEVSLYPGEGILENALWRKASHRLVHRLPDWLVAFCRMAQQEGLAIPKAQAVLVDVTLVANPQIQAANREFRHKDEATDVLSFPTLNSGDLLPEELPEAHLGDVLICIEWAHQAIENPEIREQYTCRLGGVDSMNADSVVLNILDQYVVERLTHGCLHLLGYHHDTMPDYNRVVTLQTQVLDELFRNTP